MDYKKFYSPFFWYEGSSGDDGGHFQSTQANSIPFYTLEDSRTTQAESSTPLASALFFRFRSVDAKTTKEDPYASIQWT